MARFSPSRPPAQGSPDVRSLESRGAREGGAAHFGRSADALAARVRDGVLDLLDRSFARTATQRMLDTRLSAWLYDRTRDAWAPVIGMPAFAREADDTAARLALAAGDVVLDVACGHGDFTVELARRVGGDGLVVGLDISGAMLARAARRVRRAGLDNVLLVLPSCSRRRSSARATATCASR
jgi:SAM-dependent methyltransferase